VCFLKKGDRSDGYRIKLQKHRNYLRVPHPFIGGLGKMKWPRGKEDEFRRKSITMGGELTYREDLERRSGQSGNLGRGGREKAN